MTLDPSGWLVNAHDLVRRARPTISAMKRLQQVADQRYRKGTPSSLGARAMPDFDYVLLADYVRQDAGTIHIMAAGLDTIALPAAALPAAIPLGLAARITFSSQDEVGAANLLSLAFRGPSGDKLLAADQHFRTPPPVPGVPPHWRTAVGLAVRMPLLVPAHGNYALEVMLNDDPRLSRTLYLRAIEPPG